MLILPSDVPETWRQQAVEKNAYSTATCVREGEDICQNKGIHLPPWWGSHSRGHETGLEQWREMLASDLCESQCISVSVLSQGPRKEKRQFLFTWRLNMNSACAWGEPQFAQIVQFLKLCFCQHGTILTHSSLVRSTTHTWSAHSTGIFYSTVLCVLPLAFPSHLGGGCRARWLLTRQCRGRSATPLTPPPEVSEQPTQTFCVEGCESISVAEGMLIIEPFTDFL